MLRPGTNFIKPLLLISGLLVFQVCLISCTKAPPATTSQPPVPTYSVQSPTTSPPTSTALPLAARVNQEEISLSEYQAELIRYQSALGTELATQQQSQVLNNLIDQYLLAQEAYKTGYKDDEAALQERISALIANSGSEETFNNWMTANSYTMETFAKDLRRSIAADWMRDQIIAQVPPSTEQIHVRQILLYNFEQAEEVLALLEGGTDFSTLAVQYDPTTHGDLGWFPRGYLLYESVEEAAFNLDVGKYSEVIESPAGFHILQLLERDENYPLEPDAFLTLQGKAIEVWLQDRRSVSQIEILVPLEASGSIDNGPIRIN